jgi:hypothetical protein
MCACLERRGSGGGIRRSPHRGIALYSSARIRLSRAWVIKSLLNDYADIDTAARGFGFEYCLFAGHRGGKGVVLGGEAFAAVKFAVLLPDSFQTLPLLICEYQSLHPPNPKCPRTARHAVHIPGGVLNVAMPQCRAP